MITYSELIGNRILLISRGEKIRTHTRFRPGPSKRVVCRQPWILIKRQAFYLSKNHAIHKFNHQPHTHTSIYIDNHTLVVGIIGWMRVQRGLVLPLAGQVPQFKSASQALLVCEQVSPIYIELPERLIEENMQFLRSFLNENEIKLPWGLKNRRRGKLRLRTASILEPEKTQDQRNRLRKVMKENET